MDIYILLQSIIDFLLLPQVLTLVIVLGSIVLFISDRFPIDAVAFIVLLALLISGLVPEERILDGFSSQATIAVGAMFVLSAALERTGMVRFMINNMRGLMGHGRLRLTGVTMGICGFFSAFINNTATVAVLLPVIKRMSRDRGIHPGKLLMAMSFAAQFGGVCTLIGTTTNLLVNGIMLSRGLEGFTMFEFAKLGIVCFVVGTLYMLVASHFLARGAMPEDDAVQDYRLQDYLTEMRVLKGSALIGQTGQENKLHDLGDLRILEIIRGGNRIWAPQRTDIREGDNLLIRGPADRVLEAADHLGLQDWAQGNLSTAHLHAEGIGLVEVIIPAGSNLIGRTLNQMDFYWRYHAAVLGVRRRGQVLRERIAHIVFQESDTLLLQGHKSDLDRLAGETDFTMMQDLSDLKIKKQKALTSVFILLGVVGLTASGVTSLLTAALVGAGAMVATGCLRLHEAYKAIDFKVIMLLAGMIPLGIAMEQSGTTLWLVNGLESVAGRADPFWILCFLYLVTMVLTAIISNNATAVLLAPLGLGLADTFQVDPRPFLMAITFAASTCFTTPVGYQTNAMVYGPGGYRYRDFMLIGLPLNILFFAISVTLIPLIWPFLP